MGAVKVVGGSVNRSDGEAMTGDSRRFPTRRGEGIYSARHPAFGGMVK
jgi:hypothetical protein